MDKLERIENLPDFLAAEGLEVVRGEWLRGSPYPVLFVRPKSPPPQLCVCGHTWAQHDHEGCLVGACWCSGFIGAL